MITAMLLFSIRNGPNPHYRFFFLRKRKRSAKIIIGFFLLMNMEAKCFIKIKNDLRLL